MADLRATRLSKRFSGIRVVNDVNLTIRPGEVVGYLGPNGSGKTTTARMLGGPARALGRHRRVRRRGHPRLT